MACRWTDILASHIYQAGERTDRPARKFYQQHQAFLAYLSSPHILGTKLVKGIHSLRMFSYVPWGREIFEYFLQDAIVERYNSIDVLQDEEAEYETGECEEAFAPVELNAGPSTFLEYLIGFRVAIAASCLPIAERPSNPLYHFGPDP